MSCEGIILSCPMIINTRIFHISTDFHFSVNFLLIFLPLLMCYNILSLTAVAHMMRDEEIFPHSSCWGIVCDVMNFWAVHSEKKNIFLRAFPTSENMIVLWELFWYFLLISITKENRESRWNQLNFFYRTLSLRSAAFFNPFSEFRRARDARFRLIWNWKSLKKYYEIKNTMRTTSEEELGVEAVERGRKWFSDKLEFLFSLHFSSFNNFSLLPIEWSVVGWEASMKE